MTTLHNPTTFTSRVSVVRSYAPQAAHVALYTQMLDFLAARGVATSKGMLNQHFAAKCGSPKNLLHRLNYLVDCGLVLATGVQTQRGYTRSSLPVPNITHAPAKPPRQCFVTPALGLPSADHTQGRVVCDAPDYQVVPPRQHNVMQGIYVPPRGLGLRPGAQDFAAVPSRGMCC